MQNYSLSLPALSLSFWPPLSHPYQVRSDGRVLKTDQGLLLRSLQASDSGVYVCTATEKNFKHTLMKLQLVVLSSQAVNSVLVESGSQYRELLSILSQPEMGLINQYCHDYWQLGDTLRDSSSVKPSELNEQKKPRNRRHHHAQEHTDEEETWGLCLYFQRLDCEHDGGRKKKREVSELFPERTDFPDVIKPKEYYTQYLL